VLDFGTRLKTLLARSASTGLSALVALGIIVFVSGTARERVAAVELLPGPVPGRVMAVIGADTLAVAARIWLGQEVEVRV
jgi:xanthine/uracil permease